MLATVHTATIVGVEAVPVEVQVDVSSGLPSFGIVGLGDAAVMEARERVRSAIRSSGFEFPNARVVVNLAPAPLRKHGTGFDLPIALGILSATRQVPSALAEDSMAVGELALDGSVRPVSGMLAHALAARRLGRSLLGPPEEASPSIEGLVCLPVTGLTALRGGLAQRSDGGCEAVAPPRMPDLGDVAGHEGAKRALEIAAAGRHNLIFVGPPGSGKTMLARRLVGILPPLDPEERLETALVHSVAGLDERPALAGLRPFRSPHHTCSVAGLVGGGSPPRPGEVSLAHNGVLFLDEFPEFGPAALQTLRQPLEDGLVTLVRAEGRVSYPARCTLVAAMNPCPCGYLGDPERRCRCSETLIQRYGSRIGGPLMDRMDLQVPVERIDTRRLLHARDPISSAVVRDRVIEARQRSLARSRKQGTDVRLLESCSLEPDATEALTETARRLHLSGRAVTRLLRVARTVADLDGADKVTTDHVMEAVTYRTWEAT